MEPDRTQYAAADGNLNGHDGFVADAGAAYVRLRRAIGLGGGLRFLQGVYMDEKRRGQDYVVRQLPGTEGVINESEQSRSYLHCGKKHR
jgi:hypothetical protein